MSETEQEQVKPRKGARIKSGPNAELAKRRAERMQRGSVDHGFNKRLGLDDSLLDHANYRYRWVNDTPGNISHLTAREWELVKSEDVGGQDVVRFAGRDADGKGQQTVLMRKYKPWFDEDAAAALSLHKKNMADMMRGTSDIQRAPDSDGHEYALSTNRIEEVVNRPVRNPDFE
jgi:hypothetical protein